MNDSLDFNPSLPATPLRRELHPKATVPPDAAGPVIDFRSSDQTLDRYSELITVAGWHLDNYRKNPVVQNAHSYSSLSDTIGKALITEIRSDAQTLDASDASTLSRSNASTPYLFQRIQFAVEENPMAKVAYGLYKGGFLNAVSVGFIPLRWENGSQDAGYRRKYLEQELVEVSAVSIPANPNALTLALKAGAVEKSDLKELFDLLRHICSSGAGVPPAAASGVSTQNPLNSQPICSTTADPSTNTSALGAGVHEAQLLQLAKQLHEIRTLLNRA